MPLPMTDRWGNKGMQDRAAQRLRDRRNEARNRRDARAAARQANSDRWADARNRRREEARNEGAWNKARQRARERREEREKEKEKQEQEKKDDKDKKPEGKPIPHTKKFIDRTSRMKGTNSQKANEAEGKKVGGPPTFFVGVGGSKINVNFLGRLASSGGFLRHGGFVRPIGMGSK